MILYIFIVFLGVASAIEPYGSTYENKQQCPGINQGKRYINFAFCRSIGTLRDDYGNVIKGVCEITNPTPTFPLNYEGVIQLCRSAGMDLFVAETSTLYNAFMQYINGQFGNHPCKNDWDLSGCGIWIGGKFDPITKVWSRVKDWSTIPMNIAPYTPNFIKTSKPGDCIAVKNSIDGFKVVKYNCNVAHGKLNFFYRKVLIFLLFYRSYL